MSKIIALTGIMGAGKSTAVTTLREHYDPFVLVKLAAPLYELQELIYNRISSVHKRPDNFIKDRKLLQLLGTDWGRDSISTTLWTDLWQVSVKDTIKSGCHVICDDLRFNNEAEIIKDLGGIIIKLTTNRNHERIDTTSGIPNHPTEYGIDNKYVDYTIENDGTLEEFELKLIELYKTLDIGS